MFKGNRILAVIPARGGSKGILHKNIIDLCGKPLIAYSIEAALKSKYIDYVMVSTDDEQIAKVSKECGAHIPFMRPAELASDFSKTIDAVLYSINMLRNNGLFFSDIVLLQPTEPLRTVSDINNAIEFYFENGRKSLVSVSEVDDHPLLIRTIRDNKLEPLLNTTSTCRRQDMPQFYKVNGCIYINAVERIKQDTSFNDNEIPYIMEKSHSVDIDDQCDLALAKYYIENKIEIECRK